MNTTKHLLTLRFRDEQLEEAFKKVNNEKSLVQARLAALLGMILYGGFIFLDYHLTPEHFITTLMIRLSVVLLFGLCLVMTFIRPDMVERIIMTGLVGGQIGHFLLMLYCNLPPGYGMGVTVIILVFMFTFSRITFIRSVILSFIFIAIYEAITGFHLHYSFQQMLTNNYFLLSINFAGILAGYTIELFVRNDFTKSLILDEERRKSDNLLLNILPESVAHELKEKGTTTPVRYGQVTVMFTDFVGFTTISERLSPDELIHELSNNFCYFDTITKVYNLEKIKTIGDSYMLAGGIPHPNSTHHFDCMLAALQIKKFMNTLKTRHKEQGLPFWDFRLGMNTGPLIAGVIGEMKFAYDIFGDTVNVASRMESHGAVGEINISQSTYDLVKEYFDCEYRGNINIKGKGSADMYIVRSLRPEYSSDPGGTTPNKRFFHQSGSFPRPDMELSATILSE